MGERVTILHGDCMAVLPTLPADSVHAVVTDPPYHLTSMSKPRPDLAGKGNHFARRQAQMPAAGFMGKQWDGGDIAFRPDLWREVLRVLKPGGHVLAFGGTRTYHRLACAVEDAGFEIRDAIMWHYGSGFPKSHDVGKGIDRAAGAEREVLGDSPFAARKPNGSAGVNSVGLSDTPGSTITAPATDAAREWQGWGTALKPATEIIVLARKPLGKSTVAANVQAFGTGALNIDGCRIEAAGDDYDHPGNTLETSDTSKVYGWAKSQGKYKQSPPSALGRWPANIILDGSEEVLRAFPETQNGGLKREDTPRPSRIGMAITARAGSNGSYAGDLGSAARFFYTAKADKADRLGSVHPTVKPVDLIAYLCRLICPPGGTILDPFAGSGTLAFAAMREGFNAILIEKEAEYVADIRRRIAHVSGQDAPLFAGAP